MIITDTLIKETLNIFECDTVNGLVYNPRIMIIFIPIILITMNGTITDLQGGVGLDTTDFLVDKMNIKQELLERLEFALDMKAEVIEVVRTVYVPKLRIILEMTNLDFMGIGGIADRLNYSGNHIVRLHNVLIE